MKDEVRRRRPLLPAVILLAALAQNSHADDFVWDPVTDDEWAAAPDTAAGQHAVMLFEKITADDSKFFKSHLGTKAYWTIYRRIKVFDPEGHGLGDVIAPYLHRHEEIEEIRARTLLPDGREIPLTRPEIREKEIFKTKGVIVRQKAFSLPGISRGCIVEYRIKYRLPNPTGVWMIQKEIPLRRGEYRWLFFRGRGLDSDDYREIAEEITPNYFYVQTTRPLAVEIRPSEDRPEELFFSVTDLPAFEPEPFSPPDIALQTQLRCYYGAAANPDSFWAETTREVAREIGEFCEDDERVDRAVAEFKSAGSEQDKIEAAYAWLQRNVRNVTYLEETDGEFKENETADKMLERGYGTQADINLAFHHMLRRMGIESWMAYAVDRDENFFVRDAKYWQFDRSLVAVPAAEGEYRLYSPGDLYLPSTHMPAVSEGSHALLILDGKPRLIRAPYSPAHLNRTRRTLTLALDPESEFGGRMVEHRTGHGARTLRLLLNREKPGLRGLPSTPLPAAMAERLRDHLGEGVANAEIDSISVGGDRLEESGVPVTVSCHLKLSGGRQPAGSRLLLQPFGALNQTASPFQAEERHYPIVFDHAYELMEMVNIDLGPHWLVEALPADTTFVNAASRSEAKFASFGQTLSIQRLFRLERPLWNAADYPVIRELFRSYHGLEILSVVLVKAGPQSSSR